ncbi:BTAD domain-containing putative transcriptional regulator [Spirillospora sp. NPDC052269]
MQILILGSVEMCHARMYIRPMGRNQRTVLAKLGLHANRPVALTEIIEAIWAGRPPRTAATKVHGLVSGLRKLLADHVGRAEANRLIATRDPGYILQIQPHQLDLDEFEQRWAAARDELRHGRADLAGEHLHDALALWRGSALLDVADNLAASERPALEERRLTALEERIGIDLQLGRHADLVSELTALVAAHPFREVLRAHLMTALWSSGRTADALACFRAGQQLMSEELGLEPGPDLRRLHLAVLTGNPAFPRYIPPPHGSPSQIACRSTATAAVISALSAYSGTPRVAVISGEPGAGKTIVSLHVAHRLRSCFPDGQVHVELNGSGDRPLSPREAMAGVLQALRSAGHGAFRSDIPADPEELTDAYREALSDRRILVILDNAAGAWQIEPLLPMTPNCAVLITSRSPLEAVPARTHLTLGSFASYLRW